MSRSDWSRNYLVPKRHPVCEWTKQFLTALALLGDSTNQMLHELILALNGFDGSIFVKNIEGAIKVLHAIHSYKHFSHM